MRISSAPSIERVTAPDEERESTNASTTASPERKETVSLSTDEKEDVEAAAAAVRKELASSRSAHLANIEAAVRNGSYRPDPRLIAERILQSAALDAQIDATLRRDIP